MQSEVRRCCVTKASPQKDREGHTDNQEGFSEKVAFHPNSEALEQTEPGKKIPSVE